MSRAPSVPVSAIAWSNGLAARKSRAVPAEVPVALVYDGTAEAVMMATPADLEDFAIGFSLNERVVRLASDLSDVAINSGANGIEIRIALGAETGKVYAARRRRRVGPVGCGLCGIESLEDALPALPEVNALLQLTPEEIIAAMRAMAPLQTLNEETRAVHAAGFFVPGEGIVALREDAGRHNALDKLAGSLHRAGRAPPTGAILMTSRLSVELVQKAAVMGAPVLAAVSVPTALAIAEADKAGITLCGIVRDDGLEIFTHPERMQTEAGADAR